MSEVELSPLELKVALLWTNGSDTLDISLARGMPAGMTEADVYRILPAVRAKRRRLCARERALKDVMRKDGK